MAIRRSFVLHGTKQDLIDHLTARHQEEALAAAPEAKGTGKEKYGHDLAAGALQWAIEQLIAWEDTGDEDAHTPPGTNGSTASERRRLAAADATD